MDSQWDLLESLRQDLYLMIEQTPELTSRLVNLADEMDEVFKNVKFGKLAGASAAIGGGVMAGIGFVLSFFTFGASFGLTVAGNAVGNLSLCLSVCLSLSLSLSLSSHISTC